jgi:hypothetical protein
MLSEEWVVGAAGEVFSPGFGHLRLKVMGIGQLVDQSRGQHMDHLSEGLVERAVSGAVEFEVTKEQGIRSTCPIISRLAADCVRSFDGFRAPPSAEEMERRRSNGLTGSQEVTRGTWTQ